MIKGEIMEEKSTYVYQVRYYSEDIEDDVIKEVFEFKDEALKYIRETYSHFIYDNENDVWRFGSDYLYIYKEKVLHES